MVRLVPYPQGIGATTLGIIAFSITTLSIMTPSIRCLLVTLSITTLSIMAKHSYAV